MEGKLHYLFSEVLFIFCQQRICQRFEHNCMYAFTHLPNHTQTASLSLHNWLQRRYSNAAVVPSVRVCVCPSHFDLVNTIENKLLCASSSNLADILTMTRG